MKPGRFKRVCNKCGKPFSTHSTNRYICYRCKDYCRETHYFYNVKPKEKKVEKKEEKRVEKKIEEKAIEKPVEEKVIEKIEEKIEEKLEEKLE